MKIREEFFTIISLKYMISLPVLLGFFWNYLEAFIMDMRSGADLNILDKLSFFICFCDLLDDIISVLYTLHILSEKSKEIFKIE